MSRPSSSSDGTPYFSSWSSEIGVEQLPNECTSSVGTGCSGGPNELMMARNFLYVRGGVPPLFFMILTSTENVHYENFVTMVTS